jgi:hypothetical protein
MLPSYEAWRKEELSAIPYPRITTWHPVYAPGVIHPKPTGVACMTGFRDKDLQQKMEQKGFEFSNSVTKKTTLLLVKDREDNSEKKKKAEELGVRILTREEAIAEYI